MFPARYTANARYAKVCSVVRGLDRLGAREQLLS